MTSLCEHKSGESSVMHGCFAAEVHTEPNEGKEVADVNTPRSVFPPIGSKAHDVHDLAPSAADCHASQVTHHGGRPIRRKSGNLRHRAGKPVLARKSW